MLPLPEWADGVAEAPECHEDSHVDHSPLHRNSPSRIVLRKAFATALLENSPSGTVHACVVVAMLPHLLCKWGSQPGQSSQHCVPLL